MQSALLAALAALPEAVARAGGDSAPMPAHAPFVALAFLGTGAALALAGAAVPLCLALRRRRAAAVAGGVFGAIALFYGGLLLALALGSRDRVLTVGGRKYFCELDCHLAYSVAGAERIPEPSSSGGTVLAVRVRTWFDPSTIAPFRGNAPLTPGSRAVWLVDAAGRRFVPSDSATRAYGQTHGPFAPLSRPLAPGESYESAFAFEIPPDSSGLRLFLGDPPGIDNALLGHENSPLHGKIYFALSDAS